MILLKGICTNPFPLPNHTLILHHSILSLIHKVRGWISANADPERYYVPPVQNGEVMQARGICKVLNSKVVNIPKGSLVMATCGWSEYPILPAAMCQPIPEIPGLSITHFLGALGGTGLTAYYGFVGESDEGHVLGLDSRTCKGHA